MKFIKTGAEIKKQGQERLNEISQSLKHVRDTREKSQEPHTLQAARADQKKLKNMREDVAAIMRNVEDDKEYELDLGTLKVLGF